MQSEQHVHGSAPAHEQAAVVDAPFERLAALASDTQRDITDLFERLATMASGAQGDSDVLIADILMLIAESHDVGVALIVRVDGPALHVMHAVDRAGVGVRSGDAVMLGEGCGPTMIADALLSLLGAARLGAPAGPDGAPDASIDAYTGTSLYRSDGQLYGTLYTLYPRARPMQAGEVALLTLAGRIIMQAVEADELRARERRLMQEVAASEEQLRTVYGAMACGVMVRDAAGTLIRANEAAQEILGLSLDSLHHYTSGSLSWWPAAEEGAELPPAERPDLVALRTGQPQRGVVMEIARPDGQRRWLQVDAVPVWGKDGEPAQVVSSFIDITARKQAKAALQASQARLALQYAITTILAQSATLDEAIPELLQTICNHLGWDVGVFWSVDAQDKVLCCHDIWHQPSIEVDALTAASWTLKLARGVGLPGRVWDSAAPILIPDLMDAGKDALFARTAMVTAGGLCSVFGLPILTGGEVHSVVEFFSRDMPHGNTELVQVLTAIGVQIGQFVERTQAESETLAQLKRAELLLETSNALNQGQTEWDVSQMIVESAVRLVSGIGAALWCLDPGGTHLQVVAASPGLEWAVGTTADCGDHLSGPIWETGAMRTIDDLWYDATHVEYELALAIDNVGAYIAAPLTIGNTLLAVVGVYHREARPYSAQERMILSAFANQAASTLRNVRLRDELAKSLCSLDARTKALEAKTREQEAFIYTASHDLKAPLLSLRGMAGILLEDYTGDLDTTAQMYLTRIAANADKMQTLLNDLLEISRVGRVDVDCDPVDLGTVVDEVIEQLQHTLAARGAQVRVSGQLPTVHANHFRMIQIFTNLIDNAVTYTPAERTPQVEVCAHAQDEQWEIVVSDNGIGIPAAFRERVLGIFQRLPAGASLNQSGSGMGLAIVARIVESHGGRIWIESGEGAGTAVHFTLPRHELVETNNDISDLIVGSELGEVLINE